MFKTLVSFIKNHIFQTAIVGIIFVLCCILAVIHITDSDSKSNSSDHNQSTNYPDLKNTVLLSSGDCKMTFDEGLFFAKNKQAYYEAYYLSSGYTIDWSIDYEDGKTFEEVVLDESLNSIKEIFLFSEYAIANGYTLTDEDRANIDSQVASFLTESNKTVIEATMANEDVLNRIYTRTAYHDKLCADIYSKTDLTVDEKSLKQCLVAAVEISPKYFDSPDRTAKAIQERVNKGELITEVADIYDLTAVSGNVGLGDMDGNALETLCLSLSDGQCEITEIDGTYFVVYCYLSYDAEATSIAIENKIDELKQAAVTEFYTTLLTDMPLTVNDEAWTTINYDEIIFTEEDITSQ